MRSFGLEDMTDAIWDLCKDEKGFYSDAYLALRLHYCLYEKNNFFSNLGIGSAHFNRPVFKVFNDEYGYIKGESAGKAMSLLSKYFYFVALEQRVDDSGFGFPIYDSLALDQFPKVYNRLGIKLNKKLKYKDNIDDYVKALEVLRKELFSDDAKYNFQHFDLLDAYLWRMGKFDVGNISLLNTRQEYTQIIENLELRPSQTTLNKEETEDQKQKKEETFANQVVAKFKSTSVTDILKNIDNCDEAFKSFLEHWKKIQEIEGEKEE
jgi:hypothetical protein